MSWWDDIVNTVSEQASRAATAAGNTAAWIGDGLTHPGQAISTAVGQVANAPAYYDALNHGFSSVEAYQNYLAKQPQGSVPNNPVNNAINGVVNAIPGAAPILANGANYGTSFGPGSPNGSGLNAGMDPTPRPNNSPPPSDAQIQSAVNAQNATNPAPHLNVAAQPGQIVDVGGAKLGWNGSGWEPITSSGMVWTGTRFEVPASNSVGMTNINLNTQAGATPSNLNTDNLRVGDHRTTPTGQYQTWNGTSWNDGNSAAAPAGTPMPTIPVPQVNTSTQNPVRSATQWAAERDAIMHRYYTDMGYSPEQKEADLAKLGPQPAASTATSSTDVPPLVAAPPPGTPGVSTAPTGEPNPAAAVGGAAAAAGGLLAGLDPNIAALIASLGASGAATYLASKNQADASVQAAQAQLTAYNNALAQQQKQFEETNKINAGVYKDQKEAIAPWLAAGNTALTKLGSFDANNPDFVAPTFNETNWQDPGYAFRLGEGVKALQHSAAAKGLLQSGDTLKGITDYAQGAASQEYQNAFSRYQTDTANTFNRFQSQRGMKLNEQQGLAGIGQTATQQANAAGATYAGNAQQAGQTNSAAATGLITGAGNAAAGGITGAGAANASGWVGGGNLLTNALSQFMNYNQGQQSNALMAKLFGG